MTTHSRLVPVPLGPRSSGPNPHPRSGKCGLKSLRDPEAPCIFPEGCPGAITCSSRGAWQALTLPRVTVCGTGSIRMLPAGRALRTGRSQRARESWALRKKAPLPEQPIGQHGPARPCCLRPSTSFPAGDHGPRGTREGQWAQPLLSAATRERHWDSTLAPGSRQEKLEGFTLPPTQCLALLRLPARLLSSQDLDGPCGGRKGRRPSRQRPGTTRVLHPKPWAWRPRSSARHGACPDSAAFTHSTPSPAVFWALQGLPGPTGPPPLEPRALTASSHTCRGVDSASGFVNKTTTNCS